MGVRLLSKFIWAGVFPWSFFLDHFVTLYIVQLQVCSVDLILFQLLSPVWNPQLQILRFYKQYYYVKNTRAFCSRSFIPIDDDGSFASFSRPKSGCRKSKGLTE